MNVNYSFCTILFEKIKISRISTLNNYISILCSDNKQKKIFIVDEELLSVSAIVDLESPHIIFIQGSKEYILIKEQNQYYLINLTTNRIAWQAEHLAEWLIEDVKIYEVNENQLFIVSTYKTKKSKLESSDPAFLVKKSTINVAQKK